MAPREALAEWVLRLTWQLRIWHNLPYCVASARSDPGSSMNPTNQRLITKASELLDAAKSAGSAVQAVTAEDVFELVTTLSWGVDRYRDDETAARRRVAIATARLFATNDASPASRSRKRVDADGQTVPDDFISQGHRPRRAGSDRGR